MENTDRRVIEHGNIIGIDYIWNLYVVCKVVPEQRFNNYMPPEGMMVDHNAQALDRVKNHLTDAQVKQNTINGKYNTKSFL